MKVVETSRLLFLERLQPSTHMSNNMISSEQKRLCMLRGLHLTDPSGCIPVPCKVNYSTWTQLQEEVCETWHVPWSHGRFSRQSAIPEVNRDRSQPGGRSFWGFFFYFLIEILSFWYCKRGGESILYPKGSREYWIFFFSKFKFCGWILWIVV